MRHSILWMGILIGLFGLQMTAFADAPYVAKQGILDLHGWDFKKMGIVNLAGEWEIYWDRLILPGEFAAARPYRNTFQVPDSWSDQHSIKRKNGHNGFATYRLIVVNDYHQGKLALSIINILTNFKIYVNGELVAAKGMVEKGGSSVKDHRHAMMISDTFEGAVLEIVVQVANYHHSRGGIYRPIYLGPFGMIEEDHHKQVGFELFLFGAFLIIGVYHLGNFYFRNKDLSSFFFGLLCLLISVRLLMMGTRFAALLFPGLGLETSLRFEFLTVYLSLPVFCTFLYYLYPVEFSARILGGIVSISLILSLSIIPFKEVIYDVSLIVFEVLAAAALGYAGYVLIKAIKKSREGAGIIFCGFVILAATAVNDILYEKEVIMTGIYLPIGILAYLFFQALHLSRRSTWNLNRNEELSAQLAQVNVTLEHRVKQRMAELNKRNEQLKIEIAEHKRTAEKLAEAKLLAESANQAKSEFLANMSHELRTPMHGILGFAKFGEDRIDRAGRDSLLDYFREIKSCGERLLVLLNDLLDLSKLESGKILYDFQSNKLSSVVETVLKEFDAMAKGKNIGFNFQQPDCDTEGVFDEGKMIQVVRNLVSNAIKYSPEHSVIAIQITNQDDRLSLSVIDRGIGIPENELKEVFDKFVQSSKTKSSAGGTGLGLPISQKIIADHRGEIWAQNNAEGGATFTFVIPKHQKTKKKLGEILIEQKLITKEDLINTLKSQLEE